MKKKLVAFLLAVTVVCALCSGVATAAETRASYILVSYQIAGAKGDSSGEFKVKYDVEANKQGTVGIESIEIYKWDDTYVTTITGTVSNGLLETNTTEACGTYVYTGTPGESYYAIVTLSARAGTIYDSRQWPTATVKTPT